jgi:uncharacterized protein (TIGR02246 family)
MQTDDEQEIGETVAAWLRESAAGNVAAVLALMTDDAVFLVAGKPPVRGKRAFAAGQEAFLHKFHLDATSEIQEIEVVGNWAYAWTTLRVVMTPREGGDRIERTGPTLSIFRKESGRWLLTRDANMLA